MSRLAHAVIFTLMLVCSGLAPAQAELSDAERYVSYPFMNRAWQAVGREDWEEAESLTRYLLQRVPAHTEARALLAQLLARKGHYGDALVEIGELKNREQAVAATHELRMRWIADRDPGAATVSGWLKDASPGHREQLWQSYSLRLQESGGTDAALKWLRSIELPDSERLLQWRAVLAEMSGDARGVVSELRPLLDTGKLDTEQWRRLGLAYVELADDAGVQAVLDKAPDNASRLAMRRLAGEQAIAAHQPERALHWLAPLENSEARADTDPMTLWELGRQTGDVALVTRLAETLKRPCLETAEWLIRHDRSAARAQLTRCEASSDPQRWMVLAERLEALDLMASRRMPGKWESLRQERLVERWRSAGQSSQALRWLEEQPADANTLRMRAELLQELGDERAAQAWVDVYQRGGQPGALDQATYLLVQQGRNQEALGLLRKAFAEESERSRLRPSSLLRLAALASSPPHSLDEALLVRLLPRLNRVERTDLLLQLANKGHCDVVAGQIPEQGRLAGEYLALAACADPKRPGVAVVYYQKAIELGARNQELALAYALQAAGEHRAALDIWLQQEASGLRPDHVLAAARSALGAGEPDQAEVFWRMLAGDARAETGEYQRLGAQIALAQGQYETALARDRRSLELSPTADAYYAGAATALAANDPETSLEWLGKSVEMAPDNGRYRLDYGLRLSAHEDHAVRVTAVPHLERSRTEYPADYRVPESLSLRYQELGQDRAASAQMQAAIDLHHDELMVATESAEVLAERRYAMRRSHEVQTRRDSFTLASTWSPYNVSGSAGQPVSGENYQVAMWDRVLEDGDGNAGKLAVYGRVLTSGPTWHDYFDAVGFGFGVRAKPWREQNINLYAELYHEANLEGDDSRGTDLLLRATASFLDQGEYRNDWRPTQQNWPERSLYLDAAWFVRESERLLLARYQQGHTFKLPLPGAQTLMPYLMAQAMAIDNRQDVRVGAGLRWQLWFDDDRYNAFRARVAIRLEYQRGLGGSLYDQADGWLLGAEMNW